MGDHDAFIGYLFLTWHNLHQISRIVVAVLVRAVYLPCCDRGQCQAWYRIICIRIKYDGVLLVGNLEAGMAKILNRNLTHDFCLLFL